MAAALNRCADSTPPRASSTTGLLLLLRSKAGRTVRSSGCLIGSLLWIALKDTPCGFQFFVRNRMQLRSFHSACPYTQTGKTGYYQQS